MDFGNFTERARAVIQAAQMIAVAERHQQFTPEHLIKALIDDAEGLAARLVRDAGGDPDLLREAAEEALDALTPVEGEEPHPIYMSQPLAAVLQRAVESAHQAGDKYITAERLLESLALQGGKLRKLFARAGVDAQALAKAVQHLRQ